MNGLVEAVSNAVPAGCHTKKCRKQGCTVSMRQAPERRVVIDLDCRALSLEAKSRSDLVFVGEAGGDAWVAPIEMKGGRFDSNPVAAQLQGGADASESWLPRGRAFLFVPTVVHGRGVHKAQREALRRARIRLRGYTRQPVLIKCGESIKTALDKATGV
ncbi:MAG: hypothetical protein OXF27_00100 [Acidobacteria bacterium]|nr:hypothetical protein [Acidobacteriota bacterium]